MNAALMPGGCYKNYSSSFSVPKKQSRAKLVLIVAGFNAVFVRNRTTADTAVTQTVAFTSRPSLSAKTNKSLGEKQTKKKIK